jgi:voltage-gated potassium channel
MDTHSNLSNMRNITFQLIEGSVHKSPFAKFINAFLITLIIANVVAIILESDKNLNAQYSQEFALFELISVSIFTIEYILRAWTCIESYRYKEYSPIKARIRYLFSPVALIDFIAIAPFFISLFFVVDLRYLRLLRILRLLKLTHYFKGFNIFLTVLRKELKSITAAIMVMMFLIIIAACLMYTLENEAQPEVFGNILQSLWWAVVTMTTVGYGDVTPVTLLGKIVSTFIMLIGVGLVALPAGMLAARFGDELRERKRNLDAHVKHALADGIIDAEEFRVLEELTNELELSPDDLKRNIAVLKKSHHGEKCPYCGK